ncbi:MAG: Fur family transcriptional regulator [Nitriliruptorales bacterium]|nr:Fur family transcriptional regulator [Nitriliruptorales bacterium]
MTDDVHAAIREALRHSRQRYTRGRQSLVELLLALGRPVTIPDLVAAGAPQAQSSLYRNLSVLEQCGVVRRLPSTDDAGRYELAEELTEHHHHLVCTACGRVDDVVLPSRLEASLDRAADAAGDEHGYALASHRLELVGVCPGCR